MMKHFLKLFLLVFLFCNACKKETSSHKLIGSIDISEANTLIFASVVIDPYSSEDISDSLNLYKLTGADEIHPVTFLTDDDKDLGKEFVPDGIYNLNHDNFLFNVYHKKTIDRFILNAYTQGIKSNLFSNLTESSYNRLLDVYIGESLNLRICRKAAICEFLALQIEALF